MLSYRVVIWSWSLGVLAVVAAWFVPGGYKPIAFFGVLAVAAYVLVRRWRTSTRRACAWQRVECRQCGYDMRGSPSDICPECGHRDPALTRSLDVLQLIRAREEDDDQP